MRHPIHSLLAHHAYAGSTPSAEELAELKVDAAATAAVKAAAAEARELHSAGEQGNAHVLAHEHSHTIIAGLSQRQQDPRYLTPDPNDGLENLGPAELAARVPRR
jgi:hypothetical protein